MIHNMTGGGAGLNLKVIGGTSRPGGSDTLTWDGNTKGLVSVADVFYKVSDATPSIEDFANGGSTMYNGDTATVSNFTIDQITDMSGSGAAILLHQTEQFLVALEDNIDFSGFVIPEKGIYLQNTGELYVSSLTIPGYTGFGGSVKDNTIWVNTDTDINGYAFSATEPASPVEGMVWIKTGASSAAAFNAHRKNILMLYPLGCMQYISGAWVEKQAQLYTGGKWTNIASGIRIMADGVYDDTVTGGWISGSHRFTSDSNATQIKPTVETSPSAFTMQLAGTNYFIYNGSALSAEDIDFTDIKRITFKGTVNAVQGQVVALSVMDRANTYTSTGALARVEAVNDAAATEFSVTLDVNSIVGSYALAFGLQVQNKNTLLVNVTELILETD